MVNIGIFGLKSGILLENMGVKRRYLVLRLGFGRITSEPLQHSVPEACWW